MAAFIGGGFLWASLAPLSSAAIAPGAVKVETNRKTVQHLEGGIIREILVREGDRVTIDQPLIRLDDRDAESDRGALRGQIDALAARESRLVAQRDGRDAVFFPNDILERQTDIAVEQVIAGQKRIFIDQKRALQGEVDILLRRIQQHRAQADSVRAQIAVTREQLPKLEEELRDVRSLFSKGLGLKPRVLDLERRVMAAKGDIAANESRRCRDPRFPLSDITARLQGPTHESGPTVLDVYMGGMLVSPPGAHIGRRLGSRTRAKTE